MAFDHYTYQGDVATEYRADGSCIYWRWNPSSLQAGNMGNTYVAMYDRGNPGACPNSGYGTGSGNGGGNGSGTGGVDVSGGVKKGEGTGNSTGGLFFGIPGLGWIGSGHGPDLSNLIPDWLKELFQRIQDLIDDNADYFKKILIIIAVLVGIMILLKFKK